MSKNKPENRLDKIYTRSGDAGKTSLAQGKRIYKSDNHIKALGDIDELNCVIGVLIASYATQDSLNSIFTGIQNTLFDIGGELAMNDEQYPSLEQHFIDQLEQHIDQFNLQLTPLKEFILPGGHISAAQCHLARAVCRRAERQLIELTIDGDKFSQSKKYLNRLSDFLFVAARILNKQNNYPEPHWQASTKPN
ncbi:MAG: cob(I)yrinic acid a,c-diamide adenosyltransferase [Oceanospirillaceae bacterium]|nr:cob(I)yrinic acid a,c-diamide adenosyltransferase [Oceanospirillaceae bacterium]